MPARRVVGALLTSMAMVSSHCAWVWPDLLAGAARRSITPPADIGHVSLGGYGDRHGKASEGVHDDILARALALKGSETTCVIVALDRLEVPPFLHEDVCKALSDGGTIAVTPENLIITASHTHSAPENLSRNGDIFPLAFGRFNDALYDWTLQQIVDVVKDAIGGLRTASVGATQVRLDGLVANRRDDGVIDPELTVVWFTSPDGAPIAVLTNFAAHPTMLGPENLLITGEWPGEAERLVEAALGHDAVCLFTNGAQGDQRPAGDFGSGFDRVAAYGRRMADEILATREGLTLDADVQFALASREMTLPERQASPAFIESAQEEYPIPPDAMQAVLEALFPATARAQALRIGDTMLVTVPGEMIATLGIEVKAKARERGITHPFIAGLANTYCGYILTPDEYQEGGYEAAVSVYGPDFGPWLVEQLGGLIEEAAGP